MTQSACRRCGAPWTTPAEAASALQGMCARCLIEIGLEEDAHVVITGTGEEPAPPPTPEELQPLFPHHTIEALLGQGGMGVVYRARQTALDRAVAIKVLPAKLGRDPAFAERFAREARALAALDHPCITRVFDFGKAGEHHYLVMELVDGVDLRRLMRAGRVEPRQALSIVEQVCEALQYAHDQGVVHRDIKPENVLVDRKGGVKITDFGLAKLIGAKPGPTELTRSRQVMGTPHYMAPEQIERPATVDHRADIYSLGVVFYELLTGELPLGRFAPPSGKVRVDVRLDEVVLRALEKEPELRYQSAGAVRTDVHGIREPGSGEPVAGGGGGRRARADAPAGAGGRGRSTRWWVLALALLVLLSGACVLGTALLLFPRRMEQVPVAVHAVRVDGDDAERLRGLALLADDGTGAPVASAALRQTFGVSADGAAAAAAILRRASARYEELLRQHTRTEVEAPGARVTIEPFASARDALVEDVERELRAVLPRGAGDAIAERDAVRAELFPLGGERVVHVLRPAPGGYDLLGPSASGELVPASVADLPASLRRHLEAVFEGVVRPIAPSVVAPLERILAEIAALADEEGVTVETRRVLIQGAGPRRGRDAAVRASARADLIVRAGDPQRAAVLLGGLADRLRAGGARVDLGGTAPTPEGDGIRAKALEVELEVENPGVAGVPPDAPAGELDLALRAAVADVGVGPLEIVRTGVETGPLFEDATYNLEIGHAPDEALAALFAALEGLGRSSAVSSIELGAAGDGADGWRVEVDLRARRPVLGNPR